MYLFSAIIILIVSFYLHKKAAGTMKVSSLNMISWLFYFHLFFQYYLAALLVVYGMDNHYMIAKIQDPDSKTKGFWAIMYTMIALPLGMLLVNLLVKRKVRDIFLTYCQKPIVPLLSKKDSFVKYPLYLITVVCIFAVIYTFFAIGNIPLMEVIRGRESIYLLLLRDEAGRSFQGNVYLRNLFGITLTPILSYIAYSYFRMTRSLADRIWFYILLFFSLLIISYNLAKAPILYYLIGFLMFKVLENGKVSMVRLAYLATGIFVLLVVMYIKLSDNFSSSMLFSYNSGFLGRMLLSQSAGVFLTFDLFPDKIPHIGINSISDVVSNLFGLVNSERSSRLIMEYINPRSVEEGTAGVINTLFIAEAYANFGYIGLILAPIYVGVIIQALNLLFLLSKKTPLILGLFVYFSYQGTISGGFNDYLYNAGYFMLFIVIFVVFIAGKYLKERHDLPALQ